MNASLLAALLLGLRHATDPDHLTALSTLVLGEDRYGARRASTLGLSWGLGHAVMLLLLGLPVVLFHSIIPDWVTLLAERAVGVLIVVLAIRLLLLWRRGRLHTHAHRHGDVQHSHPHVHERSHGGDVAPRHQHAHAASLGRTPLAALGIGMAHGAGGSAAVGLLIVTAIPDPGKAALALLVFAMATALSMALASAALGHALTLRPVARQLGRLVPVMGVASALFGVWWVVRS